MVEVAAALHRAAQDFLPFAVVCLRDSLRAETLTLEVLLVALENGWVSFALSESKEFTHTEFREEIYRLIWKRAGEELAGGKSTPNLYYTEMGMPFYRLAPEERAALHLRMKGKLAYDQIGRILDSDTEKATAWVEAARTRLLGRNIVEAAGDQHGPDNA